MTVPAWQAWLAELKRRKVFHVAAVYGATFFVVLQVADLTFPRLGLPDWTVTLVVALGLLAFPIAIVLSWAYETGPDGLRRTDPAAPGELAAIVAQPRHRRWPIGLAALAGLLLLSAGTAIGLGFIGRRAGYDSIAVLPFVNMSGDSAQEYFGDGLAEELLNALANIEGLKVAARTSAFALKNTTLDARAIGDTLGVATVLEGSVRRSGDQVRITAQLIDARTGYHLWSDTYDRPMTDLFVVQSEISTDIVEALSPHLDVDASELHRGGTSDVEAYNEYLLGRQKWATRDVPLLREAVAHFEAALARDSSFALAWSGLADAIDALAFRDPAELRRVPEAKYAAQRALALDPELAEAWASLGVLYNDFDRDFSLGELALRRAIALKPSYAETYLWMADMMRQHGRLDESLEASRRALELDPLSGFARSGVARDYLLTRQWQEARAQYAILSRTGFDYGANALAHARQMGLSPDEAAREAIRWGRFGMAIPGEDVGLIGRGIVDPALRPSALALLHRIADARGQGRYLAPLFMALGDTAAALDHLEQAMRANDARIAAIGTDPAFDPLRSSPRFIRMVEALGVPNGYFPDR